MKEEVLKNTNYPIPVLVKTIEKPDIIGLEEALELKRRFYTVRCSSTTGTLYKIDLKVIILLIYLFLFFNKDKDKEFFFNFCNLKNKKLLF
jgi:hypothetical protein